LSAKNLDHCEAPESSRSTSRNTSRAAADLRRARLESARQSSSSVSGSVDAAGFGLPRPARRWERARASGPRGARTPEIQVHLLARRRASGTVAENVARPRPPRCAPRDRNRRAHRARASASPPSRSCSPPRRCARHGRIRLLAMREEALLGGGVRAHAEREAALARTSASPSSSARTGASVTSPGSATSGAGRAPSRRARTRRPRLQRISSIPPPSERASSSRAIAPSGSCVLLGFTRSCWPRAASA
jgi:hypothetical protein